MFILRWLSRIFRPFSILKKYLLTLAWMSFVAVLYFSLQLPMKIDCEMKCYDGSCYGLHTHLDCPQKERTEAEKQRIGFSPTTRGTRLNFIEYLISSSELSDGEDSRLVLPTEDRGRHEGPSVSFPIEKLLHRPRETAQPVDKEELDTDASSQSEGLFPSSLSSRTGAVLSDIGTDGTIDAGTVRQDTNADHVRINDSAERIDGVISQNGNLVSVSIKEDSHTRSQGVVTSSPNIVRGSASLSGNTSAILNFSTPKSRPTHPPQKGVTNFPQILPQKPSDPEEKNPAYVSCSKVKDKDGAACVEIYYGLEKKKCAKQDLAANLNEYININSSLKFCPCIPPNFVGRLKAMSHDFHLENLWKLEHRDVELGGEWHPSDCRSRTRLAIIVPYRDRLDHLKIFLHHMLPILKRQLTHFRIFVVEQNEPTVFNKAAMMNIGFLEAMKQAEFDCVIFHDVDIVMEDDRSLLNCGDNPHHYAISLDRWNYRLKYETVFGAVISLRPEMFNRSNGFSNSYFGWGGEDDDMGRRIRRFWKVDRPPMVIGRYTTLNHTRDTANAVNKERINLMKDQVTKMKTDGLNSIRYEVKKIEKLPLFTWILANLDVTLLPYPDHVSYAYILLEEKVCADSQAMSALRQRSLLTCQYDCAMEGPRCVGFNHRVDEFDRQCWLIKHNCSSFDPVTRGRSATPRTYLKGTKIANKGKRKSGQLLPRLNKFSRFRQKI